MDEEEARHLSQEGQLKRGAGGAISNLALDALRFNDFLSSSSRNHGKGEGRRKTGSKHWLSKRNGALSGPHLGLGVYYPKAFCAGRRGGRARAESLADGCGKVLRKPVCAKKVDFRANQAGSAARREGGGAHFATVTYEFKDGFNLNGLYARSCPHLAHPP